MKSILIAASLILGTSFATAGELDNDGAYTNQQSLQGTVVVRVNTANSSVAYLKSGKVPASEREALAMAASRNYQALPASKVRNELDQAGGASSWYWYPGYNYGNNYNYGYNYQQSNLYWYGNRYQPCYYYTYGSYNYYYYSSYQYRW